MLLKLELLIFLIKVSFLLSKLTSIKNLFVLYQYPNMFILSYTRYMFALLQVLCLIAFICSSIDWWVPLGQGWAQFVFISALITTLIFFIFHLFNVFSKLPGPWVFIVSVWIHSSFLMLIFFHNSLRNSHLHEYWYLILIIYITCMHIYTLWNDYCTTERVLLANIDKALNGWTLYWSVFKFALLNC